MTPNAHCRLPCDFFNSTDIKLILVLRHNSVRHLIQNIHALDLNGIKKSTQTSFEFWLEAHWNLWLVAQFAFGRLFGELIIPSNYIVDVLFKCFIFGLCGNFGYLNVSMSSAHWAHIWSKLASQNWSNWYSYVAAGVRKPVAHDEGRKREWANEMERAWER